MGLTSVKLRNSIQCKPLQFKEKPKEAATGTDIKALIESDQSQKDQKSQKKGWLHWPNLSKTQKYLVGGAVVFVGLAALARNQKWFGWGAINDATQKVAEGGESGLTGAVTDAAGKIEEAAGGVAGKIEEVATDAAGKIEEAAGGVAGKIEGAATDVAGKLEEAVGGAAKTAVNDTPKTSFLDTLKGHANGVWTHLVNAKNWVWNGISSIFGSKAKKAAEALATELKDKGFKSLDVNYKEGTNAIEKITVDGKELASKKEWKVLLEHLEQVPQEIMDQVHEKTPDLLNKLKENVN